MQGPNAVLNVVTIPPGATITSPRIVLDGVRGAIFVYTSGGPSGALIGSWAGTAGTDPYGNSYPAGLNVGGSNNSNVPNIYVQATAPTAPIVTNSVWINTTNNSFNTWNGSSWVQTGFNAANLLLSQTITAGLLVANIVVAGIVNGTTIQGAIFKLLNSFGAVDGLWDSGTDALYVYADTGSASQGAVQASLAAKAVTDPTTSTALPQGLFCQALTLNNQTSAPPSFSNGSVFYSSLRARPRFLSQAGDDSVLERSVVDVTQYTVGNTTTFTRISGDLVYQANEAAQSSWYEIEVFGNAHNGTASSQLWTYALFADGLNTGAQFSVGGAAFAANTPFDYYIRFVLGILGSGVGGTGHISAVGNLAANNANRAPSISVVGLANLDAWPIDTTASHTFEIRQQWGASIAGQTATTFLTKMGRRM